MISAKLIRRQFGVKFTLGVLELWDGADFALSFYTCEDAVRGNGDPATVAEWKVKGESAVPYGTYPLRLTYSPKYGRNVWQICDVPGFNGIRIHSGNTEKDTEGCILLGLHLNGDANGVARSREAVARFEAFMEKRGNADAVIEIAREDL